MSNAEEEGVEFIWLSGPKKFEGINKIENLVVNKMKLEIQMTLKKKTV